jgi:hypothetical protein
MLPQDPVQLVIVYQVKLTEPRSIIPQHMGGTYITSDTANFQIAAVFQIMQGSPHSGIGDPN